MKNRVYFIILSLLIVSSSCEDELFQNPETSKELNSFLSNQTEVEEYVNATYGNLQFNGVYGLYIPAIAEVPSDNTFEEVPANDNGAYGQLDDFNPTASNEIIEAIWQDSYAGIQKANVVLNRINDVPYTADEIKQSRIGEMEFIRALHYFNLVRIYGAVPLVTKETTDPNEYFGQGRTPQAEVYAQITKDLTDAITRLPDATKQPGRVIKTAAQTLLAKVYLTQGSYEQAKVHLQAVINSGKHSLLTTPASVFSLANENNAEIIFAVQFATGINGNAEGSSMAQQFSPSGSVSGAKGHNLPTKSLYSLYAAQDLRKGIYLDLTKSGIPFTKKLTLPASVITDGGSDVVVLRYADVLLMMAEVENETKNFSAAATHLNLVRTRAGLPVTSATTEDELRNAIVMERRLELIGEGHRWFDLLRTGQAITIMNQWFKDNNKLITIDAHHLVMPIPQSQVNTDLSIKQNDLY